MTQRCRCGADVIAELAFCVMCGAPLRPQAVTAGAARRAGVPAGPRYPVARPTSGPIAHPSFPPQPAPAPWAPVPAPQRSAAPWIAGAAAIVVLAVTAAVAVLTLWPGSSPAVSPAAAPVTVVAPSTTVTTAPASSGSGTSSGSGASSELDAQVAADRDAVEDLAGQWVPQLSSKAIGTVDGGVSYDADAILEHYRGLAATYPGAKLLDSGDWPVFKRAGYRVVVVAQPFATAAGANAWCDAQGIAADQCFAKKLSRSGGPAGTTVQR